MKSIAATRGSQRYDGGSGDQLHPAVPAGAVAHALVARHDDRAAQGLVRDAAQGILQRVGEVREDCVARGEARRQTSATYSVNGERRQHANDQVNTR